MKKLTTEEFINKAILKHGNKYDYSDVVYLKSSEKVKIKCFEHGIFEQIANDHLKGQGCSKCGIKSMKFNKSMTNEEFISFANEVHSHKYCYDDVVYLNNKSKVKIKCFEHGIFEQTPSNHLNGQGCPKCAITTFNNGFTKDGFVKTANGKECTFYVIKCFNDQEEFYKIGITSKSIKIRFSSRQSMPYNYIIIKEIKGCAETIWNIENNLKDKLKSLYKPNIKFDGSLNECFSNYEEIKNIIFEVKEIKK